MIHYRAAQLAEGPNAGKWHYVAGGAPVGYCGRFLACTSCHGSGSRVVEGSAVPVRCRACNGHGAVPNPDPCPGHDTAEEAREHYRDYLLDQRTRVGENRSTRRRCEVCREWTQAVVWIGSYRMHVLCSDHQGREHIAEVMGPIGESWES